MGRECAVKVAKSGVKHPSVRGYKTNSEPDKENKKGCVNYSFYYFNCAMIIDENKVTDGDDDDDDEYKRVVKER